MPVPNSSLSISHFQRQQADAEVGFFDSLGAVAEETFLSNPTTGIAGWMLSDGGPTGLRGDLDAPAHRQRRRYSEDMAARDRAAAFERSQEEVRQAVESGADWLNKDQAEDYIKAQGLNPTDFQVSQFGADKDALMLRIQLARETKVREYKIENGAKGFVGASGKLATGLLVSMADPINLATALIPQVGTARMAGLANNALRSRRLFARAVGGGFDAAVGTAAVEPLSMWAADMYAVNHGAEDALQNIMEGAGVGAMFNVIFGRAGRHIAKEGGMRKRDPAVKQAVATHPNAAELRKMAHFSYALLEGDFDVDMRFFELAEAANATHKDVNQVLDMRVTVKPDGTRAIVNEIGDDILPAVDAAKWDSYVADGIVPFPLKQRLLESRSQVGTEEDIARVITKYFDELDEADSIVAAQMMGEKRPESLSEWFEKQDVEGKSGFKKAKKAAVDEGFIPRDKAGRMSVREFLDAVEGDRVKPRWFRSSDSKNLNKMKSALRDLRKNAQVEQNDQNMSFLDALRTQPETVQADLMNYAKEVFDEKNRYYRKPDIQRNMPEIEEKVKNGIDNAEKQVVEAQAEEIVADAKMSISALEEKGVDVSALTKAFDDELADIDLGHTDRVQANEMAIKCVLGGN